MEGIDELSTGDLFWRSFEEGDPEYNKAMKESFILYKNRDLKTWIDSPEVLVENYPCNVLLLCDGCVGEPGQIYGGIMWWVTEFGNKLSTSFGNRNIYKDYVIDKYFELLTTPGYYAELSDALEYLLRKKGLKNIMNVDIITSVVGVDPTNIFTDDDPRRIEYMLGKIQSPPGSYLREIRGVGMKRKALYGMPCMSGIFEGEGCHKTCWEPSAVGGNRKKRNSKKSRKKRTKSRKKRAKSRKKRSNSRKRNK